MTLTKYLLILTTIVLTIFLIAFIYINVVISSNMPSLEQLENPKQNLATQILSSDGELLDHFFIERRVNLPFDSIPKDFINALIATEDKHFYKHWGVFIERIFKAAIKNIFSGRVGEGASTISMQLARNMFHSQEVTIERKIREAFTAIQIEKTYTKEEILEMYCNQVAFGRGAYGLQVAAKLYFDKSPSQLTTSECAFLAAILKAPEHYNGLVNKEKAITRRNLVLTLMHEQGYLNDGIFVSALEEPFTLKAGKLSRSGMLAPHFVELVRQKFAKEDNSLYNYDLYRDGLEIFTTIDSRIQKYANDAVEEHLSEFQKTFDRSWSWQKNQSLLNELIKRAIRDRSDYVSAPEDKRKQIELRLKKDKNFIDSVKNSATTIQVGLVVINPRTGAILALVGASPKFMKEHSDSKYSLNHVTQIKRQAGSAFKPFVYALALTNGLTPISMIECGPYSYRIPATGEVWSPGGTGCDAGGQMTLFDALRKSINVVAARLVTEHTSPEEVVRICKNLGIQSKLKPVPAIALGAGGEVSPLELTSAFGAISYNGYYLKNYFIEQVNDKFGNSVYQRKKTNQINDALRKDIAHTLTSMMKGVVTGGTGWRVKQYLTGVDAAGKTGTTNDYADAWFVGFTPELVAGVWVGFDDLRVKFGPYGDGGRAAAPIWGRLMKKIYTDPNIPFKQTRFEFDSFAADSIIQQTFEQDDYRNIPEIPPNATNNNQQNNEPNKFNFPPLPKIPD